MCLAPLNGCHGEGVTQALSLRYKAGEDLEYFCYLSVGPDEPGDARTHRSIVRFTLRRGSGNYLWVTDTETVWLTPNYELSGDFGRAPAPWKVFDERGLVPQVSYEVPIVTLRPAQSREEAEFLEEQARRILELVPPDADEGRREIAREKSEELLTRAELWRGGEEPLRKFVEVPVRRKAWGVYDFAASFTLVPVLPEGPVQQGDTWLYTFPMASEFWSPDTTLWTFAVHHRITHCELFGDQLLVHVAYSGEASFSLEKSQDMFTAAEWEKLEGHQLEETIKLEGRAVFAPKQGVLKENQAILSMRTVREEAGEQNNAIYQDRIEWHALLLN